MIDLLKMFPWPPKWLIIQQQHIGILGNRFERKNTNRCKL